MYGKYELIFQLSAGLLLQFRLPVAREESKDGKNRKMQCSVELLGAISSRYKLNNNGERDRA